jgi:hypothetical protein
VFFGDQEAACDAITRKLAAHAMGDRVFGPASAAFLRRAVHGACRGWPRLVLGNACRSRGRRHRPTRVGIRERR